jgi:hypothetical protein
VIAQVEACKHLDDDGIPQDQLDSMLLELNHMRATVESGVLPPRENRFANLTRLIVDCWPLGHPVGAAISDLEVEYRQL